MRSQSLGAPAEPLRDLLGRSHEALVLYRFSMAAGVGIVEEREPQEDRNEPRRRGHDQ